MYLSPMLLFTSPLVLCIAAAIQGQPRDRAFSFTSQGRRPFSALVVALQHEMAAFSIYPLHICKIPPMRI